MGRHNSLREESEYRHGTRLFSKRWGVCRVRYVYSDHITAIIGDKPIFALADVNFRLDADGRVWEWDDDIEIEVLVDDQGGEEK